MREALTVRELIQETDLGLELVSDAGLDRAVHGIHLSDLEDPAPFMVPGMVLLTTGEPFASQPAAGIRLLDRLSGVDAAALGVGVGHHMDHVDPRILSYAAGLRIPVFEAPLSVPFRTITSYVYNALASTDMHRLRRSLAFQGHLLDLLLEQRSVEQLVAELAMILEADVILFDEGGGVVARAGPGRAGRERAIWAMLKAAEGNPGPLGVLEDAQDRIYVRRVMVHGVLERVLVAATPGSSSAEFVDTALSYVQRLLVVERLQEFEQVIVRRRMRSLLLDDFIAEQGSAADLLPRLREQGLTLNNPWRMAVFDIDGFRRDIAAQGLSEERIYEIKTRFIDALAKFLGDLGIRFLSSVQGDSVVALLAIGDQEPHSVVELLTGARIRVEEALVPLRITVGCSGRFVGPEGGSRHFGDAMEALKMASEGCGVASRVVLFDEAGGRFRLVEGQTTAALKALRRRLLTPLEDYDRLHHTALVATLGAYIDSRLSPSRTAEALFVHRSTLEKRLRRIESLLGFELGRMDDVVEMYLALRAAELLQAQVQD